MRKVYLAGGFKSRWQDLVQKKAASFEFIDPSLHNIENPSDYTDWDLRAIDQSDIIFAYMEDTNPGGYALALEVGYAKANNKKIIFVADENMGKRLRYFDMVKAVSDQYYASLEDGIDGLNNLTAIEERIL